MERGENNKETNTDIRWHLTGEFDCIFTSTLAIYITNDNISYK